MRNDIQYVFAGYQLDSGAEVLQGYAQLLGVELCTAFGGVVLDNQLYELAADFLLTAFNPVLGVGAVAVQLVDTVEKRIQHILRHACFGHVRPRGYACQQREVIPEIGGNGFVEGYDGGFHNLGIRTHGGLDDVDPVETMFGKSGKADAHLFLLPVKLDDSARKERYEVALLNLGIH